MNDSPTAEMLRMSPTAIWIRKNIKVILSVVLTSIVWLVVQSFSVGAYREKIDQMDKHMESIDKKAEEEKSDRQDIKQTLGEIKTTVNGMDNRLGRVEDWRDGIRRDVQDANSVKIPKLVSGHRAHN